MNRTIAPGNSKIKWRSHEITLVTATAILLLTGYLWYLGSTAPGQFSAPFINNRVPFNFFKNVVLPDISIGLFTYAAYLWLSLYTIPRLLFPKKVEAGMSKISVSFKKISFQGMAKKIVKEYVWLFIQLALIILIVGIVNNVATYYRHEWLFNYPGFSIFFNKNNPKSQMNIGGDFFAVAASIGMYGLYACAREIIINLLHSSKQREYNVSVCNKVTVFLVPFFAIAVFLQAFKVIHDTQFFVSYCLAVPAIFAMFISNVYWLFPLKGDDLFTRKPTLTRLLITSFIYAVPLMVFTHEAVPLSFLLGWALQLFVVTPLTWLYYKANKEKILQLKIVESALAKSKTDLQYLRSQINPHFLFNVLNTLYGTALQENAERSAEGIQKLGDMMRFMLHENNLDFIEMTKEVEYLKNYIALQKLRTQASPGIIIEDSINEQNCNHRIAPMLLIPLVENAFKHGISLQEKSWIKISLTCTQKNILFEVRNSVHEKMENDPEKERSGIGFKNVMERLKLIYPDKFQVSVNRDENEFFVKLNIEA